MRRLILLTLIGLFFIQVQAQVNERNQIHELPKFEICESDQRDSNACFKVEFIKLLKKSYHSEELAYDQIYNKNFEALVKVNRKGQFSVSGFSTAESQIFVPFQNAIVDLPKVKPALNALGRPIELKFKIEIHLERTQIKAKNAIEINIDLNFQYDEEAAESFQVN